MINASRTSDFDVQIDLPRARGMRFSVEEATKLRDMLTDAIRQPLSSDRAMAVEAVRLGRQAARHSPYQSTGKIEAIKTLRDMSEQRDGRCMSLFDAKTLVESAWGMVP